METQIDMFDEPAQTEPECPGVDVCPVAMCGCRWLSDAAWPWREGNDDRDANAG